MTTYAIGDVQGCARTLERLLARIRFVRQSDRLWFVGDLVNRGAHSLDVLRLVTGLGDRVTAVLGNHDVHLLARAAGIEGRKQGDTLEEVLHAPDRDDLLSWLRLRPFLYREGPFVLVHAGLHPRWTVEEAEAQARAAEGELSAAGSPLLRAHRQKGEDNVHAFALAVFTRMRTVRFDGRLCAKFTGPPHEAPVGCRSWFDFPARRSASATIVFGHWAALGFHVAPGLYGLDTGCVWGGSLTAVRLDDGAVFQEPQCRDDRVEGPRE